MISALKLFCDACLYLAFLTLTPYFMDSYLLIAVVPVVSALAGLLADRERRMPVRIILGLLPLVSLTFVSDITQVYFLIPLYVFVAYSIISDQMNIAYDDYRYWFGIPAVVVLAMMFVIITSDTDRPMALLFGALYLISGVITLRGKRLGSKADKASKLIDAFSVLAVVFSTATIICLIYGILINSEKLFETIMFPIGFIIKQLISLLVFLGKFVVRKPDEINNTPEQTADDIYNEIFSNDTDQVINEITDKNDLWVVLLYRFILIVIAIAILVFFISVILKAARSLSGKDEDGEYVKGNGEEEIKRKKKEKTASDHSNRQKIRNIYREFLYHVKRNGIAVNKNTTSEDILDNSEFGDDPNAIRLRELYIRARYQQDCFVSADEVNEARTCLEMLTR